MTDHQDERLGEKQEYINVKVKRHVKLALAEYSSRTGESMSTTVRQSLLEYIKNHAPELLEQLLEPAQPSGTITIIQNKE